MSKVTLKNYSFVCWRANGKWGKWHITQKLERERRTITVCGRSTLHPQAATEISMIELCHSCVRILRERLEKEEK